MGIFKRAAKIVESEWKDRQERRVPPEAQAQAVYERMIGSVSDIKRMIGEVAAAHERAQQEVAGLEDRHAAMEEEAREALSRGDEERAREVLVKRRRVAERLEEAQEREAQLRRRLERLRDALDELRDEVRTFEDRRDDVAARLSGASAQAALAKAESALREDAERGLAGLEDEARVAEARADLSGGIDEELARLREGR
jgi:phage shock protein A